MPFFGDAEQEWPRGLRIVLYLFGLGWCFMGVAIIADVFMGAIERITSQKQRKYSPHTGRTYTAVVWNPTVANLTLMALGSSAPEILLNVFETVLQNNMFSGDLGPSTIVGSAAFNLLIIIAVCVSSIPDGEVRRIKEMPVYIVTAVFSIFAYIWMLIVLMVTSPNVVEVWEGVLTLLFFPILVSIAWMADKGYLTGGVPNSATTGLIVSVDMSKEELAEVDTKIRKEYGAHLTDDQVQRIMGALNNAETHSRAHYRVHATRALTGGKRVKVAGPEEKNRSITAVLGDRNRGKVVPITSDDEPLEKCFIEFATTTYAVMEGAGSVKLKVARRGVLDAEASVKYKTRDGTAKAQSTPGDNGDYLEVEGWLSFGPGETDKVIEIEILDDNSYEEDEDFYVDLFDPIVCSDTPNAKRVHVSLLDGATGEEVTKASAQVTIIDDDAAGTIFWAKDEVHLEEASEDREVAFEVHRKSGSKGRITCKYQTENASAVAGLDYEATEGEIVFEDGIPIAKVVVKILTKGRYGTSDCFRVMLTDVTGQGAKFDPNTDGGEESCIMTVQVNADKRAMERVDRMMSTLVSKWDKAKIGHSSWRDQFVEALYVNGGDEEDDDSTPSIADYVLHVLTLPWKLIFACCPPTDYCGGWFCFVVSLMMIGGVTILIGDMANLFGCVIPFMQNEITAITFVALGTSLPDTFASKTAAMQDPYADASVGNVTGSNSVNVFLGLGLPWFIASIYWTSMDSHDEWTSRYQYDKDLSWLGAEGTRNFAYVVKAGSLGFSVIVFTCCAITCIAILAVRRLVVGGELGGPKVLKWVTSGFLVFLWCMYIFMSILKIKGVL